MKISSSMPPGKHNASKASCGLKEAAECDWAIMEFTQVSHLHRSRVYGRAGATRAGTRLPHRYHHQGAAHRAVSAHRDTVPQYRRAFVHHREATQTPQLVCEPAGSP